MFNKAWIYLALILIPIALLFDARALLVISAFLLTTVPVAWWWNRRSLDGVEVSACRRGRGDSSRPTTRIVHRCRAG